MRRTPFPTILRVADHLLKRAAGEVTNVGYRLRMTKQRFRSKDDQRFADAPPVGTAIHLAAQQVEILRGRGAIADLNIIFRAEL